MTIIIKVIVFILGIYISMRTVAALYGLIDLRYTIKTAWPRVIRRILFWGVIATCLAVVLGQYRYVYLWGLTAYILIYLLSYFPSRFKLAGEVKSVDIE